MMLDKEFQYYLEHQDELVQKYKGKVLAIVDEKIVGVYDDEATAYLETIKNYEPGKFLLQLCTPGEDDYTQTFHSRVSFA